MKTKLLFGLLVFGLLAACRPGAPAAGPNPNPGPDPDPPPEAPASVLVFAAGDIATGGDGDEATAGLIEARAAGEGWRVLALGDLAYPDGSADDFQNYYEPSWGRFKERTWPVPGNHEYHTSGAAGYYGYWGERAQGPDGWYAFTLGGWRLYALNSNCSQVGGCDEDSDQYAWLAAELERDDHACALAFAHRPRYSPGPHGDGRSMDAVWDLLVAHGVELYLSGHDHLYARYRPRGADGAVAEDGVVQFVVGSGGAGLYEASDDAAVAFSDDAHWGVLELTLEPEAYAWRFVTTDGVVRDEGRASCR